MILKTIAGPLIGAAIGYFTNNIAVKMLFYPRREVRLWGHKLPFTPGAIPKGKERLAKAVGDAGGGTLITREDIEEQLEKQNLGKKLADQILARLNKPVRDALQELPFVTEESYQEKKQQLAGLLSDQLVDAIASVDFYGIITERGRALIREKIQGTMLDMLVSDQLLDSILTRAGREVQSAVTTQARDVIFPIVLKKLESAEAESGMEFLSALDIRGETLEDAMNYLCARAIREGAEKLLSSVDIAGIVEEKINAMSVEELETLVLGVMKKELNTIVNLGALIGFVLGLLNIVL